MMAAFVAVCNKCEFCVKAHTAVAQLAYGDAKDAKDLLSNLDTAAIGEPLRTTLSMLAELTRKRALDPDDVRAVLAVGVSKQQIKMRSPFASLSTWSIVWQIHSDSQFRRSKLLKAGRSTVVARLPITKAGERRAISPVNRRYH
jgi:AhpD family alkylhydroperoxidase